MRSAVLVVAREDCVDEGVAVVVGLLDAAEEGRVLFVMITYVSSNSSEW